MPQSIPRPASASTPVRILLLAALSAVLVGCSGASDAGESASTGSVASTENPTRAPSGAASGMPPLPDAASAEGDLPRTYVGFTLGDPPPVSAEKRDGPPPFYPEATRYLVRLSESPKINVSLYVHDGTIFRFEWLVKDASIDRDDVVAAFAERIGPPEEPSEYMPEKYVYWNDGLVDGTTTITVFRRDDSEWFRVAFEDTGRTADLMKLGG